jgi:hypothetical protein
VSTVGSASETESLGGNTSTTTEGGGDTSTLGEDRDEDMLAEMDSVSASGYMGADAMDEDLDNLASQSVGEFEDRMSDDGSASLVGFGEGAGSTLSGPIYHRRPLPSQASAGGPGAANLWGLERSSSGLSEGATSSPNPHHSSASGRRDFATHPTERDAGAETPVSQSAVRERREARMVDGVALESGSPADAGVPDGPVFVDTTTRGPVPVQPTATNAGTNTIRERRQQYPYHQQYPAQTQHPAAASSHDAGERVVRERVDEGEGRVGSTALGSPGRRERLGRFYFEDR